jgi:hypothetical protein
MMSIFAAARRLDERRRKSRREKCGVLFALT